MHEGQDDAIVVVLRHRVLQTGPQFLVVKRGRGLDQGVNLVRSHLHVSGLGNQLRGGDATKILSRRFLHRRDGLGIHCGVEDFGRQVVAVLGRNGEGSGDHAGQDHQHWEDHLGHGRDERSAAGGAHVLGRHRALHDEEVCAPVAEGEHEPEPEEHRKPVHPHRVGRRSRQQGFPGTAPGVRSEDLVGIRRQPQGGRLLGHHGEFGLERVPAADVLQAEVNDRGEAEHDHEELQHLGVDGRSQAAFEHIHQHDCGADPEADIIVPAEQLVQQFRQGVHGNARSKQGHYRERDGVEAAGPLVKTELEVFGHGARLGAVIEGHHEHGEEDHGRNCAHPIEMAGGDAVLGAAGRHAHQFQRAQVGGDESQARDPRRNRAPGREEVRRALHVTLQGETNANDEDDVNAQDGVVDEAELNVLHRLSV